MTLHPEVMPDAQRELLEGLGPVATELGFYLGGGTAVALHLGHRRSVDLDWFRREPIPDPMVLARDLERAGIDLQVESVDEHTLHAVASSVRVTFLEYDYPLLRPLLEWPEFGCRLASPEDLACMKLSAVASRGARRDFVDLYALLGTGLDLPTMLNLYREKYRVRDIGHVVMSLTYFDDAETGAMPRMLTEVSWDEVRGGLEERVAAYLRDSCDDA